VLGLMPYFDNVVEASAMGAEVVWPENETLQSRPTIHTVEAMERFEIPAPTSGLWGQMIEWWLRMRELIAETRVTFNGEEGRLDMGLLGISGMGPHMTAIDLVGVDFYWWTMEYPEACRRFLDKITTAMLQAEAYFRTLDPRPRGGLGLAEDTVQIMSADSYREFSLPYDLRLYEALRDEAHNPSFDHVCYVVPPAVAAENLGGKVALWGNINPMLMLDGTPAEVKAAAREAVEILGPCGGFLLGDGANVCPGTPPESFQAVMEAAEEFGMGEGDRRLPVWEG
jgi:uroporphyrinogen-III decarboxylase